jgi:hypothetical protein
MAGWLRPLVVIAALLAVAAVAVVSLRGCPMRSGSDAAPASFSTDSVPVESPSLAVEVASVGGELHQGYLEWACLLRCKEPSGCSAQLRLTVHYTSAGAAQQITFYGPVDVPMGARARVGGVQRPPRRVDSVDRVEVKVERTITPGEPVPTPEY